MSQPETHTIEYVRTPPGTDAVLGVFVNGVEQREGADFEVVDTRIHFLRTVKEFRQASAARRALLAIGIGVYDRGDQIDVQIRRDGSTEVVRLETAETLQTS